jgi:hypothetical protein
MGSSAHAEESSRVPVVVLVPVHVLLLVPVLVPVPVLVHAPRRVPVRVPVLTEGSSRGCPCTGYTGESSRKFSSNQSCVHRFVNHS